MEYRQTIPDAHVKPVLCLQYNPFRREIYSGGEDATIRVWEETGKLITTLTDHEGWITGLLYCKEFKLLFSCAIDGMLIIWGPNGKAVQKIETGSPIYSLAYNSRRQQLMVGCNKQVQLFQLANAEESHGQTEILERRSVSCAEHKDIVSCIVSCEGRFYSAGYDKKIVIYDIPHHGNLKLRVSNVVNNAHDAAISCMIFGKDADNSWLITGSFDRSVKLWSLDGNLLQRFDGIGDTVTSLCYVLPTQTLWITANSVAPIIYDPRSGINVTDFVRTEEEHYQTKSNSSFTFKQLLFVPEVNEVLASTNRKSIVVWKFNPSAALTVLPGHTDVVESLTFTSKEPLLIFSGGIDGIIRKWERLQLNTFMYSKEILILPKDEKQEIEPQVHTFAKDPELRRKKQAQMHKGVSAKLRSWERVEEDPASTLLLTQSALRTLRRKDHDIDPENSILKIRKQKAELGARRAARGMDDDRNSKPGVASLLYYEELDLLISGFEDSKIHVWGYNEEAVKFVPEEGSNEKDIEFVDSSDLANDGVTNRVAGMSLKYTLEEHKSAVTGISCFQRDGIHWLLSTGFDRRICIWEYIPLTGIFQKIDVFRNTQAGRDKEELAADGIILDAEYCPERNEYAYASADKLAYIRTFSPKGNEMLLQAVLQGHEAEVTRIKWNPVHKQWVTASEDRTIRIWPAEGIPCLRVINNDGPVTALCIDRMNGSIVTGSQDKLIRVFDPEKKDELVQKNVGHTDEVRAIIHIPVRNQYVSASWDNSVRVWNAYLRKGQRRIAAKAVLNAPTAGLMEETEEISSFADINPLIKPKLLTKPMFIPDLTPQKATTKDDHQLSSQQSRLEEELRSTLNDLESALAASDRAQGGKRTRQAPARRNLSHAG
ncbi:WD40-repeat-containing domain protein [Phlyctochytrium arcticum]|nr:WD40-repeat-containing domain protein [Phlyctochytrium arcticum]